MEQIYENKKENNTKSIKTLVWNASLLARVAERIRV